MKNILALLLAICICFSLATLLSSCKKEHVHDYGEFWAFDEEYHWRECKCGDVIEKAPHEWGEGKVIQAADEETVGVRSYVCRVCGKDKTEKFAYDPSSGPTTTVREDQMQRAFSEERLRNVTMTSLTEVDGKFQEKSVYLFTEEGAYFYNLDENGKIYNEEYDIFTENGYEIYKRDKKSGNWTCEKMTRIQFLDERKYADLVSKFVKRYSVFPDNYNKMTYNAREKQYEMIDEELAGAEVMYAILRFESNNLMFLCFLISGSASLNFGDAIGGYLEFSFENYGTTSFEIPQNAILLN